MARARSYRASDELAGSSDDDPLAQCPATLGGPAPTLGRVAPFGIIRDLSLFNNGGYVWMDLVSGLVRLAVGPELTRSGRHQA